MAVVNHVDYEWLAAEGRAMSSPGNPQYPLLIGGSGLTGCNLMVLLANTPECKRIRVLDIVPIPRAVVEECGIPDSKIEFVRHRLGTESEDSLAAAMEGVDCVFTVITPHVQMAPYEDFFKTNIDGIRSVIKVCIAKGVPRLVYHSSIATTNHFVESVNQSEDAPLPPWELYVSPYDISKRTGEEDVLAANTEGKLVTCALRSGGILLSPNDFAFANYFMVPGILPSLASCKKVDFMDGGDAVRALLLACQGLGERPAEIGGQVFFITRSKDAETHPMLICSAIQKVLGWFFLPIPAFMVLVLQFCDATVHHVKKILGFRVPGVPAYMFYKMAMIEQTFDNSKVKKMLGFEPKRTLFESTARICSLYSKQRKLAQGGIPWWKIVLPLSFVGALAFVFAQQRWQ